jgi:protein O-GlcNAc transferase
VALATVIPSCPSASPEEILRIRREMAGRLAEATRWAVPPAAVRRVARRPRLRVGYLSASFQRPAYMKPVWGLLHAHDRGKLEIHLFSDAPAEVPLPGYDPHPTDRLHVTAKMTNEEVVALVRDAGIDLLVDLNGYGAPDRLPIFLSRPAPVTVAWFNAYATSGLPGIDWIVGDSIVVAAGERRFFSENVAAPDVCTLTFGVQHPAPEVSPPPCASKPFVTFGSLASQYKINAQVLDLWAEILRRAGRARLVIANRSLGSPGNRAYVRDALVARGITEERVTLRGPAAHLDFLRVYDEVDIALDTFPYSGGTTTMEALWQGVPVLTSRGDRWAARTSETLLVHAGLPEYVFDDRDALVETAVAMANAVETPSRLASLRDGLRRRLRGASVCDTARMAAAMEGLYARFLDGSRRG